MITCNKKKCRKSIKTNIFKDLHFNGLENIGKFFCFSKSIVSSNSINFKWT